MISTLRLDATRPRRVRSATIRRVANQQSPRPDELTDAALARAIATARAGEAEREEAELYKRFAPRVRLYGMKHLRGLAAAEDLVQQALLLTIERLRAGEVRDPDQIGSFILGSSRMLASAGTRRERRREELLERFGHLTLATEPVSPPPEMVRVESCLQQLADRDRSVLIQSYYAERSAEEIGRELGLAVGAVRVVRHRALERLRQCVGPKEAE